MTDDTPTPGPVAVITGAGSGIGRQVTRDLAADGFRVALAGRRRETLEETASMLDADAANVLVVPTDVRDPAAVAALFDAVVEAFGRVDVLFNNAGLMGGAPIEDVSPEDWATAVDTNLSGSFYCAQAAFRAMKAQSPQGGRIINNGSISAHAPRPNSVAYTSTKHAITGLTKSLALEGRPYSIAAGQIDIGNAATEMTERMKRGVPQADGSIKPEPVMDVAHVGRAVLHMARLPLEANVLSMTIMATNMPLVGRG